MNYKNLHKICVDYPKMEKYPIKSKMFRKYNILVPTLLKPSSSLVVVVHMLRIEEPLHSGLIGGKRTVLVTVKLLRGGQSVEEVIRNVVVGDSQEIRIPTPKRLGKKLIKTQSFS